MPITATYTPAMFKLSVLGTIAAESMIVSRNAAGTLLVNAGTVPVSGGTPTVANTDLIEVIGDAGADTISLDESGGALPAAELSGGAGNDTLTGGSGNDTLTGEADDDTLFGRGGFDFLYGGIGNDTLTGGDSDDQMFGEDGNDRMIWNPGDDSDLMEGGNGSDTAEVNGGNGAEVFSIAANGTRVRFDRLDPAPFSLDIGTTESIVVNGNGGDDTISATGNLAALIAVSIDGGTGNDTILAGNGADVLLGGDGNDFIDGNQGGDIAFLGAGDDIFNWDPGDGSDVVEGQAGTDKLTFNGSAANEIFDIAANGGRIQFTRNVGAIVMDTNDVETFVVNALGGIDAFVVNDLTGTDVTGIVLDLAGSIGGTAGDAAADTLTVNSTNLADTIDVTGSGTGFTVAGLTASIAVANSEGANDALVVNGLGGNDSLVATTLAAGVVKLTIDGGNGDDAILGSQGADTLLGGDGNDQVFGDNGNDTAFLGAGDDIFNWAPGDGNDIVEGQAGTDQLGFAGSNASETIAIAPNGGRALFQRDVAAVTMDLDDVEKIRFDALGGADNITVNDMTGTDVTNVELRLAAAAGGGDGAVDTVTVNGTNATDTMTVASSAGTVSVTGLPWAVSILNAEGANDRLTINGLAGDDVINANTLAAGLVALTVNGGLGGDLVVGSAGGDLVNGGDGNDTALLGAGNDVFVWNPGDDNDVIEGQAGTDTLTFNGANVAEIITITPNGGRIQFFRDVAAVAMDLNDVEVIQLALLGGADTVVLDDLTGTDVTTLAIDMAATAGGAAPDGAVDTLTLSASGVTNTIAVSGDAALITVTGLPTTVTLSQFDNAGVKDKLTIMGFGGNDVISATGVTVQISTLTIDGGAGNDVIRSNGDGTYLGGAGNDTMFAGLTNSLEAIDGGADVDTLDTTSWGGLYTINMVTGATNYSGELFTNFENLTTGAGDDTITGTDAANVIKTNGGTDAIAGAGGDDQLDGGAGADTMTGGLGNDWFFVDNAGDVVVEGAGDGANDRVFASASYTLGAGVYVEMFTTNDNLATTAISLTGNELANLMYGNAGGNALDGKAGADTMVGFGGNDFYFVDNVGDAIIEGTGEGTLDRVITSLSYTLGAAAQIEQMVTIDDASVAAINLTGNAFAQSLVGNAGANVLDGRGGADTMNGQGGNDWYLVDNAGDVIIEGAGGGNDRIFASASYTLGAGVQVEMFTTNDNSATTALNLAGNELANLIYGNAGSNALDGKGGVDTLVGFGGDDLYYVDNAADVIVEGVAEGALDRVFASVSYTLGAAVYAERLATVDVNATTAINLTGNAFDNVIYGNAGANVLDGRAGADLLAGQAGNDWYFVDNAGDVVAEVAGGGTSDRVFAKVSYTLGAGSQVEMLTTDDNLASTAINLTGNELANAIYGNAGNNVIDGKAGADSLTGMAGADTFRFTTALGAGNVDYISDYNVAADTIQLENAVFTGLAAGALAAGAFNTGAAASQADDRIIYNAATGVLLFDSDGVGGAAGVQFATLATGLALTSADFVVI